MSAPVVLVVAGHDPSGGAGVDADREALAAFGCEAEVVVTAFTDQDAREVRALGAVDPAVSGAEARAALARRPAALKLGLLPGAEHVRAAAGLLAEVPAGVPVVVDPVLAASSGGAFLDEAGRAALVAELLPRGPVVTPNLPEAARLADVKTGASDDASRLAAAQALVAAGAAGVVLTAGHGSEDPLRELVLARGADPVWLERPRVPGAGLRGTGCRHASALAAGLAAGAPLAVAAEAAGAYVGRLLAERTCLPGGSE